MPYTLPTVASEFPNVAGPTFWDQAASGTVDTGTVFSSGNLADCQANRIETLGNEWTGEWYGAGGGGTQIVGGSVLLVPKGGVLTLNELFIHAQLFEPLGGAAAVLFGPSGTRVQFGTEGLFFGVSVFPETEFIDDLAIGITSVGALTFSTPFDCTGILLSGYSDSVRTRRVLGIYTPDLGPRAPFWEGFAKSREYLRA